MLNDKSQNLFKVRQNRRFPAAAFVLQFVFVCIAISGLGLTVNAVLSYSSGPDISPIAKKQIPDSIENLLVNQIPEIPNPSALAIPSLKISAPFVPLGFNPDGSLEVPKGDREVGWFVYGAKPGQTGPAVVVGHLDTAKGPAIFANLKKIKPGDNIVINRADGSQVTYRVDSLSKYSQNNFPTQIVYGATSSPTLRLITCSGSYDKKAGHYTDNLVVFATMI